MCGFAGVVSNTPLSDKHLTLLHSANSSIRHRGPDDEGYVLLGRNGRNHHLRGDDTIPDFAALSHVEAASTQNHIAALASRRLSIIDLSAAGHMPMFDPDTDNWIAFNGEIYNYKELREELVSLGYRFHSHSDTEVLLKSYTHWGTECLAHLNGMWAFAIWDSARQRLFCARDRFGEKQLYYTTDYNGQTWVASEITPLLRALGGPPRVNDGQAWDFLMYGLADHREDTFFSEIKQLLPGQAMEIAPSTSPKVFTWYRLPMGTRHNGTMSEQADELRHLLSDSVRLRMRSDVPVAAFLSGGLDSSSVVRLADKLLDELGVSDARLRTYTNGYESGHQYDETPLVKLLLKDTTRTEPAFIRAEIESFEDGLLELVRTQEQPFHNASIFASFNLLRLVSRRDNIKVVLTGEAGDELLAGYWRVYLPLYLSSLVRSARVSKWANELSHWGLALGLKATAKGYFRALPQGLRMRLQRFRNPVVPFLNANFSTANGDRDNDVISQWRHASLEDRLAADLMQFNLPQLLRHVDRNAMHFSIETRVPFLDYRLVEFAASLPAESKLSGGYTKRVLRHGMDRLLPKEILWSRRKLGFGMAEQFWFTKTIDMLQDDGPLSNYMNVRKLKRHIRDAPGEVPQSFWMPVSLGLWLQTFYGGATN